MRATAWLARVLSGRQLNISMSSYAPACVAAVVAGCSTPQHLSPPPKGRVVVAITIDWEGAELAKDGLDALSNLRDVLGDVPITHFISAAYFTRDPPDPTVASTIAAAIHPGDELAVHLHAWSSLVRASGVDPRPGPSFFSGTDELLDFGNGDDGFDLDPDAYDVSELRALLRTSRRLLETTHLPVAKAFRAGGYLGTPKMLEAIHDEGYAVDSSAIDYHQLDELKDYVLPQRLAKLWPNVSSRTQPSFVAPYGEGLIEMPIAAVTDYATTQEILIAFESAHAQLQRSGRDVFLVVALHLETGADFAGRLGDAMKTVHARHELAADLVYTTIDAAAEAARRLLRASSRS